MSQNQDLKTIFDSFDLDHSGSISLNQLQNVVEALGSQIQKKQIQKIIKYLDINGDGKITFDEFKFWWEKGHTGKLAKLVFLKARSLKLSKKFYDKIQQIGQHFENIKKDEKINKYRLGLTYGNNETEGFGLNFFFYRQGLQYKSQIKMLTQNLQSFNEQSTNLILSFPAFNIQATIQKIKSMLRLLISILIPVQLENWCDNQLFCLVIKSIDGKIYIHIQIKQGLLKLFEESQISPDTFFQKLGPEFVFNLNVFLKMHFTISQLLSQNLIQSLLKGFKLVFNLQITSSLLLIIRRYFESTPSQQFQKVYPIIIATLVKSLNLTLKLRNPQQINNFFKKLGIDQLLKSCPKLGDIILEYVQNFEILSIKSDQNPLHQIYEFLKYCTQNIKPQINIYLQRSKTIAKIQTNFTDVSKIFNIIFNQN